VTAITETEQYTGMVSWFPSVSDTFAYGTAYTATITLTPKPGFTLSGVEQDAFSVAGASATNVADSDTIAAIFPKTETDPSAPPPDDPEPPPEDPAGIDVATGYGGIVSVSEHGTATITATQNGYVIDRVWVDGILLDGVQGLKTVGTLTAPLRSVFATFAYTINFPNPVNGTLSVSRGEDTLTSGKSIVRAGEVLTIIATPAAGYEVDAFNVTGLTPTDETNKYTVTAMQGEQTPSVEVTFKLVSNNALQEAIDLANSIDPGDYYITGDRYNGKKYIGVQVGVGYFQAGSFYAVFQNALSAAQNVSAGAAQTHKDEAATALIAAIDDLIPKSQVNATDAYERIVWFEKCASEERNQPHGIDETFGNKKYLGDYTAESANAYRAALRDARETIARLFDNISTDDPDLIDAAAVPNAEYNIAVNQTEVDTKIAALLDAYIGLELYIPEALISVVPLDPTLQVSYEYIPGLSNGGASGNGTENTHTRVNVIVPAGYFENRTDKEAHDFAITWNADQLENEVYRINRHRNSVEAGGIGGDVYYLIVSIKDSNDPFAPIRQVVDTSLRAPEAKFEITSLNADSNDGYFAIGVSPDPLINGGGISRSIAYRIYFTTESTAGETDDETAERLILSADIFNGQMMEDIKYPIVQNTFSHKALAYDWVVTDGGTEARITITVPTGATVNVYEGTTALPQTVTNGVCALSLPATVNGAKSTVLITSGEGEDAILQNYAFTCYTQDFSGMPSSVVDYFSMASQYTNGKGLAPYGINATATLRGVNTKSNTTMPTAEGLKTSPTSLGNFGGYITYKYDTPITDDPKNPYGVDFIVYGNSVDGGEGFAEPGSVLVSEDGVKWYTLAGSLHYNDSAVWDYAVTYTKDSSGGAAWTDNYGGKNPDLTGGLGYLYPLKDFYPNHKWTEAEESSITLSGVYLKPASGTNEYGNTMPPFPDFGYADVGIPGDTNVAANPYAGLTAQGKLDRTDGFDLKWAVDDNGQPVDVSNKQFHYVKIQTASLIYNGAIGEKSTEVHMVRTAETSSQNVGMTAAPASITVDGIPVAGITSAPSGAAMRDVPASGAFVVNVTAPEGVNVYINSARGASATFAKIPGHKMLRIIVQEGTKEPWIAYLNLTEVEGGIDKYSVVTFNPGGGTLIGAKERVYMPETPDKVFPAPTWTDRTFLGWYDDAGNRYTQYVETMPVALTLTARYQYNVAPGESTTLNVTFRLIGSTKAKLNDVLDTIDLGTGDYKGAEYATWIATRSYTMNKGDTMYELFTRALRDAGLASKGAEGNYVSSITAPAYYGGYELAEFTNGLRSGWMYTVGRTAAAADQLHPDRGLLQYDLKDGDVVIWHYVNDYAYEVKDWFEDEEYPSRATDAYNFYDEWLKAEDKDPPRDGSVAPGVGQDDDDISDAETPLGGAAMPDKVTEVEVTAEVKDNVAAAAATADEVTEAVETAKKDGSTAVSVKVIGADNAKTVEVSLPKASVDELKTADLALVIDTPIAVIALDGDTLAAIAGTAKDGDMVTIAAEAVDGSVIELNISVGAARMTDLGGTVTVSLPYTPDAATAPEDYDLLTVYHLADDGSMTEIKGAYYDAAAKQMTFTTTHFSKFLISEWLSPFNDIAKGEWYYKAARYAYSNGLINGTTDTTFAPQTVLTRGMLITILARDAGIDTDGGDTWYSKAREWGMSIDLTDGTNMNGNVTREQFATLLFRYAKLQGKNTSEASDYSAYTDAESVSDWAQEAMAWAVANGLITGRTATTLTPKGTATRAEAATLLQRYLENVT
jgi:hypothetical protein